MMRNPAAARKTLGQVLQEGAFVRPADLRTAEEAAAQSGRKLSTVLLERQLITQETLATVIAFLHNVPTVDLKLYEIQEEAIRLLPEQLARDKQVLALAVENGVLIVAMEDPGDLEAIDMVSNAAALPVRVMIPMHGGIQEGINSHYRLTSRIEEEVNQVVAGLGEGRGQMQARAVSEPLLDAATIADAPIVRAVDMILSQALKDRASDIHIEPMEDTIRIRYRIDGLLHDAVTLPLGVHAALVSRIKVLANMNIAERRRPQDGHFEATLQGRNVDFRVASIETNSGEMVVIRLLEKQSMLHDLAELGFLPTVLESYQRLINSPFGMITISGPTGSGKTTTLYSSLNQLDARSHNIMTIEDPVEYRFPGINQIQTNPQADITFAAGLRSILRLDPDIIMVGEIRDGETAVAAIQAALTGHLVLTSIHANDAVGSLVRLMDLGVEPFLVNSGVIGAVSQRLVRRVCPYCRMLVPAPPAEAVAYQQEMQEVRTDFYYGRGCNFCSQTGFLGRVAVFEVLYITDQIRQLVMRSASGTEIRNQAIQDGLITMRRDGMIKARDGRTTPGEVLRNVFSI